MQLSTRVALYILNHKREALAQIEERYGFRVWLEPDDALGLSEIRIERTRARVAGEAESEPVKAEPEAAAPETVESAAWRRSRCRTMRACWRSAGGSDGSCCGAAPGPARSPCTRPAAE